MRYVVLGVMCGIAGLFILWQIWLMIRDARAQRAPQEPERSRDHNPNVPAWVPFATEMVAAAKAGDDAKLRALLEQHEASVASNAMIGLIAGGDVATAAKLGEASVAIASHPDVRHQLAILASIRGDDAEAERHLRAAIDPRASAPLPAKPVGFPPPPHAPSLVNLAVTLSRHADLAVRKEAIGFADRALELMPEDPLAQRAAIMTRAHAGDLEAARAQLAAKASAVAMPDRVIIEHMLERIGKGDTPKLVATFPMHADLAATLGREQIDSGEFEGAVVSLERAFELDSTSLEIAGDLGFALSQAGREADAIAHYDSAIETIPGGNLLRINRGNARRRTGNIDGAIDDYRFLVDKAPELLDARVALVATLAEAKREVEARAAFAALVAQGGTPAEIVAALQEAVDHSGA